MARPDLTPYTFDQNVLDSFYTDRTPQATSISALNTRLVRDLLPALQQAISGQYTTDALGQLQAGQAASPGFAELMTQLYGQYGPQLNRIGSDIQGQNARAETATNLALMQGQGGELLRTMDPEYYATRATTSNRLGELLNSINLGSGLSGTEQREIEQGLAREGTARGTYGAPSASDTVAAGMRYGEAGRNRETQNRNALSQAIAASSAFLPSARTGAEMFAIGTGKTSGQNTGESRFTGIAQPYMSGVTGTANNLANNSQQSYLGQLGIEANKKDALDRFAQVMDGAGSFIGGILGGVACWVAREVYGETNPRWQMFRRWLMELAPTEFRAAYMRYGPDYATSIRNKPEIKQRIRTFMDSKIALLNMKGTEHVN